ncbi:MAG: MerR family DNA-binding transcriptional regulator, partial [Candidatus Helarchaeota archaeon]
MRPGLHFRIGEAASFLGVCTKTLRRWESSGRFLPTFRTAGGHRRYSRDALLAL